jgi:hypothetical protein
MLLPPPPPPPPRRRRRIEFKGLGKARRNWSTHLFGKSSEKGGQLWPACSLLSRSVGRVSHIRSPRFIRLLRRAHKHFSPFAAATVAEQWASERGRQEQEQPPGKNGTCAQEWCCCCRCDSQMTPNRQTARPYCPSRVIHNHSGTINTVKNCPSLFWANWLP